MAMTSEADQSTATAGRARGLGFSGLYAQSLGSMAPPYNCIVVGSVVVALASHGAAAAFLLAGLGMLFYGVTVTSLADNLSSSGGLYSMIHALLGPRAGMWFGGALVFNGIFTIPATLASGAYLLQLVAGIFIPHSVLAESWLLWVALLTPFAFGVAYFGADVSARIVLAILAFGMSTILLLDLVIVSRLGVSSIAWSSLVPVAGSSDRMGMALATGVAVVALAGGESALYFAGESRNPLRHIPRAVYGSIGVAALFYVFTSLVFTAALPGASLVRIWGGNGPLVLSVLGESFIGRGFAILSLTLVVASAIAGVISFINYIARVLLAMSRDGYLPGGWDALNRRQSPWITITVLVICCVLSFAVGFAFLGDTREAAYTYFTWLYFGVTLFLLSNYVLVCVSAVLYGRRRRKSVFRTYVAPTVTLAVIGLATKSELTPLPPHPFDIASLSAVALLVALMLYTEWTLRKKAAHRRKSAHGRAD